MDCDAPRQAALTKSAMFVFRVPLLTDTVLLLSQSLAG